MLEYGTRVRKLLSLDRGYICQQVMYGADLSSYYRACLHLFRQRFVFSGAPIV